MNDQGHVPELKLGIGCHHSKLLAPLSFFCGSELEDLDDIALWDAEATSATRKFPQDDCHFTVGTITRCPARDLAHLERARQNFYKGLLTNKEALQMLAGPLHEMPLT